MPKKIKYLVDEVRGENYIRAWKDDRHTIAVQVWKGKKSPEGEPEGDWAMPAMLGTEVSIAQSVAQTK